MHTTVARATTVPPVATFPTRPARSTERRVRGEAERGGRARQPYRKAKDIARQSRSLLSRRVGGRRRELIEHDLVEAVRGGGESAVSPAPLWLVVPCSSEGTSYSSDRLRARGGDSCCACFICVAKPNRPHPDDSGGAAFASDDEHAQPIHFGAKAQEGVCAQHGAKSRREAKFATSRGL